VNQRPEGVGEGTPNSVNHLNVSRDRCVPVGSLVGADDVGDATYAAAGALSDVLDVLDVPKMFL
jgi:hypothetical protein